jgi:orotate phosphoribosyltransferase
MRTIDRLSDERIKEMFEGVKAVITDSHFVYSKPTDRGNHGSAYVNKDALFPNPDITRHLAFELSHRLIEAPRQETIEVVVGPQTGGALIGQWLAYELNERREENHLGRGVKFVSADKSPSGGFVIKRGYDKLVSGKNVAIAEDILNSGGSVIETLETVRHVGGNPVAVTALCNRGNSTSANLNVQHLVTLMEIEMETWPEDECPICKAGKIAVRRDLGHGDKFLTRRGARKGLC